jgi:hypothetical protein
MRLFQADADFLAGRSDVLAPFLLLPRGAGPRDAPAGTSRGMLAFDPYPHPWVDPGLALERLMRFAEGGCVRLDERS